MELLKYFFILMSFACFIFSIFYKRNRPDTNAKLIVSGVLLVAGFVFLYFGAFN